jgi:transcriptional regulator with PAS, ATPase and Fis domain
VPIRIPPLRERQEDVLLLFRKFAGDCADKYRMPTVTLSDEARQLLLSYRWPGNVRELKNIVERISVIEEKREISADVLRMHMPNLNMEKFPALTQYSSDEQKMFNNEREILYSVLFDMKKDVSELKKLVHNIMNGATLNDVNEEFVRTTSVHTTPVQSHSVHQSSIHNSPIQDAETIEEAQSLEDVEKDMIRRALDRNNGRRKNAASDLKISERTLYRKIKEYDME